MAILHGTTIDNNYLIPAITGTIDQISPNVATPSPLTETTTISIHCHRNGYIQLLQEYCEDDDLSPDSFTDHIDPNDETLWIRSFRCGGGRSTFDRDGRGRGRLSRDQYADRGHVSKNSKSFKGKYNYYGMTGHHSMNFHFLTNLQQDLAYLKMETAAPYKKRNNFKGKNSYQQNRN